MKISVHFLVLLIYSLSLRTFLQDAVADVPSVIPQEHHVQGQNQQAQPWMDLLKRELLKTYPKAEIELGSNIQWTKGGNVLEVRRVMLLGDDSKGNAHFLLEGAHHSEIHEGWIPYSAWMDGRVALQKIKPGEPLRDSLFVRRKLNVAHGLGKEVRAFVLTPEVMVEDLESIRTILEGQPLLSTSVEHVPDVRRGDLVRVSIQAGSLNLNTSGTVQEVGYLNKRIKVLTLHGKRELQGVLLSKQLVEVEL